MAAAATAKRRMKRFTPRTGLLTSRADGIAASALGRQKDQHRCPRVGGGLLGIRAKGARIKIGIQKNGILPLRKGGDPLGAQNGTEGGKAAALLRKCGERTRDPVGNLPLGE